MQKKVIITSVSSILLSIAAPCISEASVWPMGKGHFYEEFSYEMPKTYRQYYYIPSSVSITTDTKYTVKTISNYAEYGVSNNANLVVDLKYGEITTDCAWRIRFPYSEATKGQEVYDTSIIYGQLKLSKTWRKGRSRLTNLSLITKIPIITEENILYNTAAYGIGVGYMEILPYNLYVEATTDFCIYPKIRKPSGFAEMKAGLSMSPFFLSVGIIGVYNDTSYQETKAISAIGGIMSEYYQTLTPKSGLYAPNYRLYNEINVYTKLSYNLIKNNNIYLQVFKKRCTSPTFIEGGIRFGVWKKV